jgi:hypothetical protein
MGDPIQAVEGTGSGYKSIGCKFRLQGAKLRFRFQDTMSLSLIQNIN